MDMNELFLPPNIETRIHRVNAEYLAFAQELARTTPAAAPLLGVPQDTVAILETAVLSRLNPLIRSNMLLPKLRFSDANFWQSVVDGRIDQNHMLHALLKTIPAEFTT
ncbi:MAG: flagellar transcriptional regulator FlhD [Georgfuchsia sp.]